MNRIIDAERAAICALFRTWPDALVWIGGSVLHLLYASPRTSYDLDLAPRKGLLPPGRQAAEAVRAALQEVNAALGTAFAVEPLSGSSGPIRVTEGARPGFAVDLSAIAGSVGETRGTVLESVVGPQAVVVPTDSGLLRLKLEALLFRRFVKASDVFDAWFLTSRGAKLTPPERRRLREEVRLREIEWEEVGQRLSRLTPDRFLAHLHRRLPAEALHGWNTASARSAIDSVWALLGKARR